MDRISSERRSWNMSQIRQSNTGPELVVRSMLHRLGFRFRLNRRDVPGKPDIVLPKYRAAIFVHGCFWHRHQHCPFAYVPKSNTEFWQKKFAKNMQRDAEVAIELQVQGWQQIIIWECETRDLVKLRKRVLGLLRPQPINTGRSPKAP